MKKTILSLLFVAAAALSCPARNPQKGTYGYLYCHMSGAGEWTAFAISRDGLHFQDLWEGGPVFDNARHARIEVAHAMPISAARTMPKAISW